MKKNEPEKSGKSRKAKLSYIDIVGVTGSIPVAPTMQFAVRPGDMGDIVYLRHG
jgi:hypothetical protein